MSGILQCYCLINEILTKYCNISSFASGGKWRDPPMYYYKLTIKFQSLLVIKECTNFIHSESRNFYGMCSYCGSIFSLLKFSFPLMYTHYPMWLIRYSFSTRKQSTYSWARDVPSYKHLLLLFIRVQEKPLPLAFQLSLTSCIKELSKKLIERMKTRKRLTF